MAKRPKRKREESHSQHSSSGEGINSIDFGMGTSSGPKRPRLYPEPANSFVPRLPPTEGEGDTRDHKGTSPDDNNSNGWQVVRYDSRVNKRRGPGNDKVKYPELNFYGRNAVSIRIADLQNLVLYTLADGVAPNWLAFKHARSTRKVVVLMVPGLERGMFSGALDLSEAEANSVSTP